MRSRNQRSWLTTSGDACEFGEGFFEGAQGVDIQVVGGFIEEQDVGAFGEGLGEVDAVAFSAREDADFLLLVGACEVERGAIAAGVDLALAEFKRIRALRDFFVDGFLRVEGAGLVNVCEFDGVANFDGAAVGFFLSRDHLEQGGLACAVRTHYPDDTAWGNGSRKPVENEAVVEDLVTLSNSKTTSPRRGPGGM